MRWAVVLAGGVGSRFWPVSTTERPKQLLPLAAAKPLLVETIERVLPLIAAERVLVVTSRALEAALRAALPMLPAANILVEPFAASTAPALAWATARAAARDPDAAVLSLHADWWVGNAGRFRASAADALELAERADVVVTVGARATRPEIGYGYIVPGQAVRGSPVRGARRIARFVEKPSARRARALLKRRALWNTGLFAWTARRFRAEIEVHTRELTAGLAALDRGDVATFYGAVKPVSVDVGLLERTSRGAVLAGTFGWDDIGSWAALLRVRPGDAGGNVVVGKGHLVDARDCVVWSDDGPTVLDGVTGLVVVRARGITLVTSAERAAHLKELLTKLPDSLVGDRGA